VDAEQKHLDLSTVENWSNPTTVEEIEADVQEQIDAYVERTLTIPSSVSVLAREFMSVRYQFNKGKSGESAVQRPSRDYLRVYAERLKEELNTFAGSHHKITIVSEPNVIVSTVEITRSKEPIPVEVEEAQGKTSSLYAALWPDLRQ